jgi:hypothetical protein
MGRARKAVPSDREVSMWFAHACLIQSELSATELAKCAGIDRSFLSHVFAARRALSLHTMLKLAAVAGWPFHKLVRKAEELRLDGFPNGEG